MLHFFSSDKPSYSTPETFDIVANTIDPAARKNLAQISKVLTQITSGIEFDDKNPSFVPINDFVIKSISQVSAWLLEGKYHYRLLAQFQKLYGQLQTCRTQSHNTMHMSSWM